MAEGWSQEQLALYLTRRLIDYKGIDEIENVQFLEYIVSALLCEIASMPLEAWGDGLPDRRAVENFQKNWRRDDAGGDLDWSNHYGIQRSILALRPTHGYALYWAKRIRALNRGFSLEPDSPGPIPDPDDDDDDDES